MTRGYGAHGAKLHRLAIVAVAALGVINIGCGGTSDPPQCSFFSNVCNPVISGPPPAPEAASFPLKLAVRAGNGATFNAETVGIDHPSFQWTRSTDGGTHFVDIPGATGAAYTLPQVLFLDDGTFFRVEVSARGDSKVLATSNASKLLASSLSAVEFSDGEFDPTDWSASSIAEPAQSGPSHTEDRSAVGGLPGAYRHMVHTMPAGPSTLRVFNMKASAVYDPKALGAIHALDYSEDCDRLSATASSFDVQSYATIEQSGRRYASNRGRGCLTAWIGNFSQIPSLEAADFVQIDGPSCLPGASCPDFSAGGEPLRFGFERRVTRLGNAPAGSIEHAIDNWQFSVWRP